MTHSPVLQSDRDVLDFMWHSWYGPTGFRCRCGCTVGYARGALARAKVCKECNAEISVTADTLMRHTRAPLAAWLYVLDSRDIPSARALARRFDFAVSSAWHLIHRVLLWATSRVAEQMQHSVVARIAVRPAMAPMTPSAPAPIVAADAAGEREAHVRLDIAGDRAWCGAIGVAGPADDKHQVCAWLVEELRRRGGVSLRWLPRWVAALLGLWSIGRGEAARPWEGVVRGTRSIPRRRLDPWLG